VTFNDLEIEGDGGDSTIEVGLRVGQCWSSLEDCSNGIIFEVLALDNVSMQSMVWQSNGEQLEKGITVRCMAKFFPHGAGLSQALNGSFSAHDFCEYMSQRGAFQVIMSGDKHKNGSEVHKTAKVIKMLRRNVVQVELNVTVEGEVGEDAVLTVLPSEYRGTTVDFGRGAVKETANIVVDQGRSKRIIQIDCEHSRVKGHLVRQATVLAGFFRKEQEVGVPEEAIATDLNLLRLGYDMKRTNNWNLLALKDETTRGFRRREQKSKRGKRHEEKQILDNNEDDDKSEQEPLATPELEIQEIVKHKAEFFWQTREGNLVSDLEDEIATFRMQDYLCKRDEYRAKEKKEQRWCGVPYKLAAAMWKDGKHSIGSWARCVRIIWDKYWTGERVQAGGQDEVKMCGTCGVVASQRHMIEECMDQRIKAIHDEALQQFSIMCNDNHQSKNSCRVLKNIKDLLKEGGGASLWTGVWSSEIQSKFAEKSGSGTLLSEQEYKQVVKGLKVLSKAVDMMYAIDTYNADIHVEFPRRSQRRQRELGAQRTLEDFGLKRQRQEGLGDMEWSGTADSSVQMAKYERRQYTKLSRENDDSQYDNG
jgi:hypothetical protein